MILIVSFADNEHVRQVTEKLTADYAVIDVAWFPSQMQLTAYAGRGVDAHFLDLPDGRRVALEKVGAVWHRRIWAMTVDPALTDETARLFAWSEFERSASRRLVFAGRVLDEPASRR